MKLEPSQWLCENVQSHQHHVAGACMERVLKTIWTASCYYRAAQRTTGNPWNPRAAPRELTEKHDTPGKGHMPADKIFSGGEWGWMMEMDFPAVGRKERMGDRGHSRPPLRTNHHPNEPASLIAWKPKPPAKAEKQKRNFTTSNAWKRFDLWGAVIHTQQAHNRCFSQRCVNANGPTLNFT